MVYNAFFPNEQNVTLISPSTHAQLQNLETATEVGDFFLNIYFSSVELVVDMLLVSFSETQHQERNKQSQW